MVAGKAACRLSGFTLIELMITILVAVVLATVAVPGFQNLISANRYAADFNEVLATLNRGRTHALAKRENVEVRFSEALDGAWQVSLKAESDDVPVFQSSSRDGRLKITPSTNVIIFDPLGRRGGCSSGCVIRVGDGENEIFIAPSGRISVRAVT